MQNNINNSAVFKKLIEKGTYESFSEFSGSEDCLKFINDKILQGITIIAGEKVASKVAKNGLDKMHQYFPVDFLPFLSFFLKQETSEFFKKFAVKFTSEILELENDFYVNATAVIRIHYPYSISRKSKLKRHIYLLLNLNNYKNAQMEIDNAISNVTANKLTNRDNHIIRYHKNLPEPALTHGPHKDTWFGHTFDAINLWYCVAGVNKDTGMVMYPQTFGIDFKHLESPNYIAPGAVLPKPVKTEYANGTMLAFNSDILHGTQLNLVDCTRIVYTIRVNPTPPKFYKGTSEAEYPDWHLSKDITNNNFENILKFPRKENYGEGVEVPVKTYFHEKQIVTISKKIYQSIGIPLFDSSLLENGKKVILRFKDLTILIIKTNIGFKGISSICPHIGISLEDGFHDSKKIYCPGHGVVFDLTTGESKCHSLKLKTYEAYNKNDQIYLKV